MATTLSKGPCVYLSAGVSVCARCLTALVRDSSFECTPCVRRRVCLFVNRGGENGNGKGGGGGRAKRSAAVFDEGEGG